MNLFNVALPSLLIDCANKVPHALLPANLRIARHANQQDAEHVLLASIEIRASKKLHKLLEVCFLTPSHPLPHLCCFVTEPFLYEQKW